MAFGSQSATAAPLDILPGDTNHSVQLIFGEEPMRRRSACTIAMLLIAGLTGAVGIAAAQTYPTKPITIIVPFAAGGGNDMMARLLAQHMGRALGQQFVIDNRG